MRNALRFGFLAAYCCWVAYGLGPLRKYLEVPYQHLDVRSELKRIYIDANDATCTTGRICFSPMQGARINPRCKKDVWVRGQYIPSPDGVWIIRGWVVGYEACEQFGLFGFVFE